MVTLDQDAMQTPSIAAVLQYESRRVPPIKAEEFLRRMLRHIGYAASLFAVSLIIGVAGFMTFAGFPFVDAFLNASMLLGGMGPVGTLNGNAGKIFASFYALYAGLVFLIAASFLFAPVFHRVLHKFHWEGKTLISDS